MKSHVTVKEMAGTKIIYAMLLACYYWMWARRDWHSFYDVIQNMVFLFTFLFFVLRAFRIRQYGKGEKDQAAIRNLRSIDAIGLKVMAGARWGWATCSSGPPPSSPSRPPLRISREESRAMRWSERSSR